MSSERASPSEGCSVLNGEGGHGLDGLGPFWHFCSGALKVNTKARVYATPLSCLTSFLRSGLRRLARASQILRYLIQAGSKMDARDHAGYAPVHFAADAGNLPLLHELVRAGSSHTWLSNSGQTPLLVACLKGDPGCVKYLLDTRKEDPGATEYVGSTPRQFF